MFCPNCGKSNPNKKTYCRQCGEVLPDLESKSGEKPMTLVKRLEMLSVHFGISAFFSFGFGVFVLYLFYAGKINETAAICSLVFFIIGLWQVIGISNTRQIKRIFTREKESGNSVGNSADKLPKAEKTKELLAEADFSNVVPASVTEETTKNLRKMKRRDS